jgi:NAD(P)H dehydrogenase (quinone)
MTILITGASGHIGSQIVELLSQWNDPSILIGTSRNSSNAVSFTQKGLVFREVDYTKPNTLAAAFVGVDKLMIISTMDYDTDTRFRNQKNAIDAAIAAKVTHI